MNSGLVYPLSIFSPCVVSAYVSLVWLRSTVTMPVLPTALYTSAIIFPVSRSLLALIVATSSSMFVLTLLAFFFNPSITCPLNSPMCLNTSVRLMSSLMCSNPPNTNPSVNTMAVVVPSPAEVAVLSAASFIILTARFSTGSIKSTDLATVTPSFVTVIPCV